MADRLWVLIRGVEASVGGYCIRRGRQTIGRSDDCDIRIQHTSVSRQHAEIELREDALTIRDLNSINGTFVYSVRGSGCSIVPGNTIAVGSVPLDLTTGSETAPDRGDYELTPRLRVNECADRMISDPRLTETEI